MAQLGPKVVYELANTEVKQAVVSRQFSVLSSQFSVNAPMSRAGTFCVHIKSGLTENYPLTLIFEKEITARLGIGTPMESAGLNVVKISRLLTCGAAS